MDNLVAALRERRDQLRNELRGDPRFQEFEQVCQLLWLYESREAAEPARDVKPASAAPATSARPSASRQAPSAVASSSAARPEPASRAPAAPRPLFVPSPTGMRAVIDAAAEYLREKGDRADSAEIEAALVEKGNPEGRPRRPVQGHVLPRPDEERVRQRQGPGVRSEGVAGAGRGRARALRVTEGCRSATASFSPAAQRARRRGRRP